jgi:hypothetical protein
VLCESCSGAGRQEFSQVDALSITICRSFSDRSLTPNTFPPLALVVRQEDFWAENVGNASKVALYRITVRLQMVWDNLSCLGTEALARLG